MKSRTLPLFFLLVIVSNVAAQIPKQLEKQMPYENGLLASQMPPEMQQKMERIYQRSEALQQQQKNQNSAGARLASTNPAARTKSTGQWEKLNGPTGAGSISGVWSYNGVFLAVSNSSLYRSTDEGNTWVPSPNPPGYDKVSKLPKITNYYYDQSYLHFDNGRIYAHNSNANMPAYYSDDMGLTWVYWQHLSVKGSNLIVGNKIIKGDYYSTDLGQTWTQISKPKNTFSSIIGPINGYYFSYESTYSGVYRSLDLQNWQAANNGLQTYHGYFSLDHFFALDNILFIWDGQANKMKRSTDYGQSWHAVVNLPYVSIFNDHYQEGNNFYIATSEGLFMSVDSGLTWQSISTYKGSFHTIFKSGNSIEGVVLKVMI